MRVPDFWTGLAFCLLGAAIALKAQGFHVPAGAASPRLFPTIVGGAMALMGAAVALRGRRSIGDFRLPHWVRKPRQLALVLWLPLAIVLFLSFAPDWGTVALALPLVVIHCLIYGLPPLRAALVGLFAGVAVPMFFIHVLGVPLPQGAIEGLL